MAVDVNGAGAGGENLSVARSCSPVLFNVVGAVLLGCGNVSLSVPCGLLLSPLHLFEEIHGCFNSLGDRFQKIAENDDRVSPTLHASRDLTSRSEPASST